MKPVTIHPRASWFVLIQVRCWLDEKDLDRLAEPDTQPFVRVRVKLRPCTTGFRVPVIEAEGIIQLDEHGEPLPWERLDTLDPNTSKAISAKRIINLDDLNPAVRKAARKLFTR